MSISFTEDMLKEAVIQADIYEIETLPTDDEIEYEFSNEFKRKMRKLVHRSKTGSPAGGAVFLRRRAVAFVAAIIILFASAMSVSAVRAAVFEFIIEVYEKFTHIFFNESRSSQGAADGFAIYEPAYIPEGFKLVNKNTDGLVLLKYEKKNDFICYSQQCLENVSININTEDVKLEELEFKGLPAKHYSNVRSEMRARSAVCAVYSRRYSRGHAKKVRAENRGCNVLMPGGHSVILPYLHIHISQGIFVW